MLDELKFIFDRLKDKRPVTHEVKGQHYAVTANGTLGDPIRDLAPQWVKPKVEVVTLGGLVDLYNQKLDDLDSGAVAFHVVDHLNVNLVSLKADDCGRRHVWATANHTPETPFKFNSFYDNPEAFLIAFRASFLFNDEAVKVQQLCSSVGSGDAVMTSDDGISQEVQIKSGTMTRAAIPLPADGVSLIPWRTFRDAAPVESKFLLRMKGVKDGLPQIALFEIDGKWKLETMHAIKRYFEHHLQGAHVIA